VSDLLPPVDLPVRQLALPPRNHRWDWDHARQIAACDSPSGSDQNERDCVHCGLIRITVHPPAGNPFRAWRYGNAKQFTADKTPKCEPRVRE
jgi:hypothetical protein